MSMYADYIKERTNDKILESDEGFVTYRLLNENQVFIVDLYIRPEFRRLRKATSMADMVCNWAHHAGCTEVLATVCTNAKGCDVSRKSIESYGMKLVQTIGQVELYAKEI